MGKEAFEIAKRMWKTQPKFLCKVEAAGGEY